MQTQNAAVAAIQFALNTDEGLAFLRCWNEGNFDAIRREWPEAPDAVFVGADPLHPSIIGYTDEVASTEVVQLMKIADAEGRRPDFFQVQPNSSNCSESRCLEPELT